MSEDMAMTVSRASRPATILIVDDDASLRMLFRLMLRAEPYHVLEADSGEQALEIAANDRPDVILLDVMLPDLNGFEVCRRLRQSRSGSLHKVIMISARANVSRAQVADAGADGFWPKPISIQDIRSGLQRLLSPDAAPVAAAPLAAPA
jgi:two-component system response regulator MprA